MSASLAMRVPVRTRTRGEYEFASTLRARLVAVRTSGPSWRSPRGFIAETTSTASHRVVMGESFRLLISRDTAAARSAADWNSLRLVHPQATHTVSAKASGSIVDIAMPMGTAHRSRSRALPAGTLH